MICSSLYLLFLMSAILLMSGLHFLYLGTAGGEQVKTAGGKTLLDSQVQNLMSAMASFAPPAAGQNTLPPDYQAALGSLIASS